MKKFSIVIPTYNHCDDLLKPCIKSIKKYTDLENVEVIIIPNGCTDNTMDYLYTLDANTFKIIEIKEKVGFIKSTNLGIQKAKGEYVVLLNNDCELLEQEKNTWLDRLYKPLETEKMLGITGINYIYLGYPAPFDKFLIFFCVMIKKEVIDKIGLLDEAFHPGSSEDGDFCFRAVAQGYEIRSIVKLLSNDDANMRTIIDYPITHKAGGTFSDTEHLSTQKEIWDANLLKLRQKIERKEYKMKTKKYSIVIPTYNHLEDLLKPCIESIIKYTELNDDIEVIVVPNGCTDGTMEYLSTLDQNVFKILEIKEKNGYTKSANAGFKMATGEYVILLNNDVEFLGQDKNTWLNRMVKPFEDDKETGVTGTSFAYVDAPVPFDKFLIFYCVMIKREVIDKIGYLDEIYSPGGGEDGDYCFRAINAGYKLTNVAAHLGYNEEGDFNVTDFPIWHKAEKTFHDTEHKEEYINEIFFPNMNRLRERAINEYYPQYKSILNNSFERHVGGNQDEIPPREKTRYEWASKNLVGKKVLEIGCSSGYGSQLLPSDIDYTGLDYDSKIVEFARINFPDRKFIQADINTYDFEHYDTIIAFEIIEHLENGLEIVEKLKQHCDCLLVTVPFKEKIGFWGIHHKLHGLSEINFQDFKYQYISGNGNLVDKLDNEYAALMIMKWKKNNIVTDVTVEISTKNRYDTTLPLCLMAVINQTIKPKRILLFDDGEHRDLRLDPLYRNVFKMFDYHKIDWAVVYGERKGQVLNHQKAIEIATTNLIWRLDDDNIPDPDVLEKLLIAINKDEKIGAVASLVLHPETPYDFSYMGENINQIDTIMDGVNAQWGRHNGLIKNADHLYSTFLFRKTAAIHGYCMQLSLVGHREETIFTYEMKRMGWTLQVVTDAITWHLRFSSGGIRENAVSTDWDNDEKIFQRKMIEWGKNYDISKLIILDNGLGDHYAFKHIVEEVKEKYPKIVMAVCYPEVFQDDDIKMISIQEAKDLYGNIEDYNIYGWMERQNWKQSLIEAYKQMYEI